MSASLPTIKFALLNTVEPIDIQITDDNGIPTDATILKLTAMDLGGNIRFTDDLSAPGTNIFKVSGRTGYYFYPFGTPLGIPASNTQTSMVGAFLFQWTAQTATSSIISVTQNVMVVSPMLMYQLPYFRLMIDKSRKVVDSANEVFLGYTDAQLVMYLESGMQIINGYQPETAMGFTLDSFPWQTYRHIAMEASLMAGVLSQQLFAIDTDIPNYSDQGTAFVIAHQPQLAALLTSIAQRLDKSIPAMKMQFVSTGSIHISAGPSYKLGALIDAAPNGSLFRNMFFKG